MSQFFRPILPGLRPSLVPGLRETRDRVREVRSGKKKDTRGGAAGLLAGSSSGGGVQRLLY